MRVEDVKTKLRDVPQKVKVEDVKTKLWCETFDRGGIVIVDIYIYCDSGDIVVMLS